jgi:hypothetical protein
MCVPMQLLCGCEVGCGHEAFLFCVAVSQVDAMREGMLVVVPKPALLLNSWMVGSRGRVLFGITTCCALTGLVGFCRSFVWL